MKRLLIFLIIILLLITGCSKSVDRSEGEFIQKEAEVVEENPEVKETLKPGDLAESKHFTQQGCYYIKEYYNETMGGVTYHKMKFLNDAGDVMHEFKTRNRKSLDPLIDQDVGVCLGEGTWSFFDKEYKAWSYKIV